MEGSITAKEKKENKLIIALSVIIPLAVAALFGIRIESLPRLGFLPPIYATINGLTAVLLVVAVVQIKKGNRELHEKFIKVAMTFSVLFLLMYVAYHASTDAVKFGDTDFDGIVSEAEKLAVGSSRYVYFFILLTHIVLSIVVIPFVLFTYVRAARGKFELHKKLAKITFPLWLYVAITGVVVYLMISPYYPN